MNNSADAADEVVKMYLQGVEVTARISGTAAKHSGFSLCCYEG